MKQSLQLNLTHHLTLTPQLQQAIRLLQLSTLDLQHEIQQQIESNPLLDATPNDEKDDPSLEASRDVDGEFADFQWSNLYSQQSNNFNESDYIYENLHCTTTSLQDYLRWQLDLSPMSDVDRIIATSIIDAINEDGFLTLSLQELHASLNSPAQPLDLEEIIAVKHRIQHLDPPGCGAANLAEALLLQLQELPPSTPHLKLVQQIIADSIDLLGQHNYRQILKDYRRCEPWRAEGAGE